MNSQELEAGSTYLGEAYAKKNVSYFGSARTDYVDILPINREARILELGCGDGATGALALRKEKCIEYVGIEMFEPAANIAKSNLTHVHVGDVEKLKLPYAENYFDALIMSEVLEHLVDPYIALGRLVSLVKPGGYILASSPNISHWRIIKNLILGRFDYADAGAMDRTHLRWFTPRTYGVMFEQAGVMIDRIGPLEPLTGRRRLISPLLGSRFEHLICYQINLVGRRNGPR